MRDKSLIFWEISGILFLVLIGSLLHFVFDWSNGLPLAGLISPVNESVWEHLKLGFWSLVLFSLIEYRFLRYKTKNFLLAKGVGVVIIQSTILLIFYTYTMFSARPILLIDISSYVLGCILCQVISYRILIKQFFKPKLNRLGLALIMIHAVLIITFTFAPPRLPIFQDSHTLTYGIQLKTQ